MKKMNNKIHNSLKIVVILLITNSTVFAIDFNNKDSSVETVEGYVTHGVNVFNNQYITDYSKVSPSIPFLNPNPPLYEIGVFVEGGSDSEVITIDTDLSRLVATNRRFVDLFGINADPNLFNKTLDNIGSNYFGFQSNNDRIIPLAFNIAKEATVYRKSGAIPAPTLSEWNKISGVINYKCNTKGVAKVNISIANAFPNALYTMWDVGAENPLTPQEKPYVIPLGGLPNVLLTDEKGCGNATIKLPYCPGRPCNPDAKSCTSYISIAHHWDQQIYGASPEGSAIGVPVGAYVGNHMAWPMSGKILQEPHNRWTIKNELTCKK